jgi:hypothetical protein
VCVQLPLLMLTMLISNDPAAKEEHRGVVDTGEEQEQQNLLRGEESCSDSEDEHESSASSIYGQHSPIASGKTADDGTMAARKTPNISRAPPAA